MSSDWTNRESRWWFKAQQVMKNQQGEEMRRCIKLNSNDCNINKRLPIVNQQLNISKLITQVMKMLNLLRVMRPLLLLTTYEVNNNSTWTLNSTNLTSIACTMKLSHSKLHNTTWFLISNNSNSSSNSTQYSLLCISKTTETEQDLPLLCKCSSINLTWIQIRRQEFLSHSTK